MGNKVSVPVRFAPICASICCIFEVVLRFAEGDADFGVFGSSFSAHVFLAVNFSGLSKRTIELETIKENYLPRYFSF
jgi:hypothetical protein